ncbi:MAG: ABC transporter permease [Nevskiales bacterium]|nr:ABC transporter permease [Nevskiales bacterium]
MTVFGLAVRNLQFHHWRYLLALVIVCLAVCVGVASMAIDWHGHAVCHACLAAAPAGEVMTDAIGSHLHVGFGHSWALSTLIALPATLLGAAAILIALLLSVLEHAEDFSVLRALGWRRRRIVQIVAIEAACLAIAGSLLGLLLGRAAIAMLQGDPALGATVMSPSASALLLHGVIMAAAIGLIGSVYPALRACTAHPAQSLET